MWAMENGEHSRTERVERVERVVTETTLTRVAVIQSQTAEHERCWGIRPPARRAHTRRELDTTSGRRRWDRPPPDRDSILDVSTSASLCLVSKRMNIRWI
jgi:hypothetical protein